jgi:hypothetical protein
MTYTAELYAAELRSTSQGIIQMIAKIMVVLIPQYNWVMIEYCGISVLTGCGIMFAIAMPILWMLPETFEKEVDVPGSSDMESEPGDKKKSIQNLEAWPYKISNSKVL